MTDAEKRQVLASSSATRFGFTSEIGYHTLARSGDEFGDATFGMLLDKDGDPITGADDEPFISDAADFSSILPVGDKLFAVTHFESRPGGMYLSELSQDADTGELSIVSTQNVDVSGIGGLWVPCAGSVTPWGSHLGSEEYPPDARAFETADFTEAGALSPYLESDIKDVGRYFKVNPDTATLADYQDVMSAYYWGFPVEVSVEESGDYEVTKHFSMGRRALELAYVMPDQRTVYMSDDGTNVGFFMYVADTAGDLTSGTLFAAKWIQTNDVGAGSADIEWIELGSASDDEIQELVWTDDIQFSDIFTTAEPDAYNECPDGFSASIYLGVLECLQVNDGMETAAAFLESSRYASMLGATVEFRKEEGITFDPVSNTLFVAMSEVSNGMANNNSVDAGGPNDIRLSVNKCGAVYALDVSPNAGTGSDYTAMNFRSFVEGVPVTYPDSSPYAQNTCSVNGIANPDNVSFIPEHSTLIIGEDSGSGHYHDLIWAYDVVTHKMTRILSTPYGSETTSPYWYPDVHGYSYLAAVVQHPYGEPNAGDPDPAEPEDTHAYVGYVGPFPLSE